MSRQVRMRIGLYAGQVRELPYHVAAELVQRGSAEFVVPGASSPPPASQPAPTPPASRNGNTRNPARHRGGRS